MFFAKDKHEFCTFFAISANCCWQMALFFILYYFQILKIISSLLRFIFSIVVYK